MPTLIHSLQRGIRGKVSDGVADLDALTSDFSTIIRRLPLLTVRPTCTADVVHTLRTARLARTPVTARSRANSVSGQTLSDGAISLDMRDFIAIGALSVDRGQIRVDPGVMWHAVISRSLVSHHALLVRPSKPFYDHRRHTLRGRTEFRLASFRLRRRSVSWREGRPRRRIGGATLRDAGTGTVRACAVRARADRRDHASGAFTPGPALPCGRPRYRRLRCRVQDGPSRVRSSDSESALGRNRTNSRSCSGLQAVAHAVRGASGVCWSRPHCPPDLPRSVPDASQWFVLLP